MFGLSKKERERFNKQYEKNKAYIEKEMAEERAAMTEEDKAKEEFEYKERELHEREEDLRRRETDPKYAKKCHDEITKENRDYGKSLEKFKAKRRKTLEKLAAKGDVNATQEMLEDDFEKFVIKRSQEDRQPVIDANLIKMQESYLTLKQNANYSQYSDSQLRYMAAIPFLMAEFAIGFQWSFIKELGNPQSESRKTTKEHFDIDIFDRYKFYYLFDDIGRCVHELLKKVTWEAEDPDNFFNFGPHDMVSQHVRYESISIIAVYTHFYEGSQIDERREVNEIFELMDGVTCLSILKDIASIDVSHLPIDFESEENKAKLANFTKYYNEVVPDDRKTRYEDLYNGYREEC